MVVRRVLIAAAVLAVGAVGLPSAAEMASHRAAYTLSLGSAKSNSGVGAIDGGMYLDLQELCDGWTLNQRMRFFLFDDEGGKVDTDISFSSWEARDGLSYRFSLRSTRAGEVNEELRGRARIEGPGKSGKAVFTVPAGESIELPPGAMFPTDHTILLLRRADASDRQVSRIVFDGVTLDGALEVNAVIGPRQPPEPAAAKPNIAAIANRPSWSVRMAFFKIGDHNTAPEYETGMRLLDNGIGGEFLFEYDSFSIRATLDRLEALPKPDC
ncbi:MAG: EipB family protein [Pseudomonadota bacterium]